MTTTVELSADAIKGLERLRQEVPENLVGKLPKTTCKDCSRKQCKQHKPSRCTICNGWLGQHTHLDYVGHAETTSELLESDLAWNWEPMAFGPDGLPVFDPDGGLWIRLTVCGVTRLGYGTADNGSGFKAKGDVRKEIIGDALRNAAMRFGWALNLWAKTDIHERTPQEEPQTQVADAVARKAQRTNGKSAEPDPWATDAPADAPSLERGPTRGMLTKLVLLVGEKFGIDERPARLVVINQVLKELPAPHDKQILSSKDLSFTQAKMLIDRWEPLPDAPKVPREPLPSQPNPRNGDHTPSPAVAAALATPNLSQLIARAAEANSTVGVLLFAAITGAQTPQELERLFAVAVQARDGNHLEADEFTELDQLGRAANEDMAAGKTRPPQGWSAQGMAAMEAKAGAAA